MKKTLHLLSVQRGADEQQQMDLTVQGTLQRLGEHWMVCYSETLGDDTVQTSLHLQQNTARIHRRGKWESCMLIEQGARNTCLYRTPYGECPLGVYGRRVSHRLTERGGEIDLCYTLDFGGTNATEHEIRITIE